VSRSEGGAAPTPTPTPTPTLARRLGTADAVFIGLGAMIGAGIFSVFAPAAKVAGAGLLIGLAIAAFVAFCNATSSAQLAAQYPTSGGTYVYGREQLGPWWGFIAGWSFVVGKTASCAAMALTFALYLAPVGWERPIAIAAVLALGAVNYVGVKKTALATKIIVGVVLAVLLLVIAFGAVGAVGAIGSAQHFGGDLLGFTQTASGTQPPGTTQTPSATASLVTNHHVLQSAGLLFFAFAGYARIATMGEEVRDPRRTIPRAMLIALAIVVLLYAAVAFVTITTLGVVHLAKSTAPLADVVTTAGFSWAAPVVRIGAAVASLGALLALLAGVGRTTLAMAREGDLPRTLAAVHPRFRVPHHAEVAIAIVVSVIVLFADLRSAIGFSSFGVLLYYFIANLSAFRQLRENRRYPRALSIVGALGCIVLVVTLPIEAVLVGLGVVTCGVIYRLVSFRVRRGTQRNQLQ
jgi:basic amino acid/polyamine antiporter, APA family